MSKTLKLAKAEIKEYGAESVFKIASELIEKEMPESIITFCSPKETKVKKRGKGNKGKKLRGIPVVLSDNISTCGIETTCASNILKGYIPPFEGDAERKLKKEGAVLLGKANINEFALPNSVSFLGDTKNPHDNRYSAGPVGGCAAVVSKGIVPIAIASDAGGAARLSAAYCGVVGFRPTYGAISRYGLISYSGSTDQISVLGSCVQDCAKVAKILGGHDKRDTMSLPKKIKFDSEIRKLSKLNKSVFEADDFDDRILNIIKFPISDTKIGIPKEYVESADTDLKDLFCQAVDVFKKAGAKCEICTLDSADYSSEIHEIITSGEASAMLAKYDGTRFGQRLDDDNWHDMVAKTRSLFGEGVQEKIMLGTYLLKSDQIDIYYRALKLRTDVINEFNKLFNEYDLLISPTSLSLPPRSDSSFKRNDIGENLSEKTVVGVNLAGLPAVSVPFRSYKNMPFGIQIIGPPKKDASVLKAAYVFEKKTNGEDF